MKRQSRISINVVRILLVIVVLLGGPAGGAGHNRIGIPFPDQELNSLLEAKNFIFDREWARAVNAFRGYFRSYPAGRYGDEAGFWLAKALNGLAGEERTIERVLDRKTEAVEALDRLEKEHPQSPWLEEARSFRKELLGEIALVGGRKREAFLAGYLKEENKTLDRARLDALPELLSWDRGWAAPVIEDLLKTVADPEGRKEAVRFAVRLFPDETESLLRDTAVRDADAGVRAEAAGALERLEMARLPVDALYFIFSARLTDAAGRAMLPEETAKVFDLDPASELNIKDAEKRADDLFHGKLRRLKMTGGGTLNEDLSERLSSIMDILDDVLDRRWTDGVRVVVGARPVEIRRSRRLADLPQRLHQRLSRPDAGGSVKIPVGDVTVVFPFAATRKTPDSVSGQVVFESGEKKYPVDFSVDSRCDQLAAFRQGDDVWLVVLMFDSTTGARVRIPGPRLGSGSPVVFTDVLRLGQKLGRLVSWALEEKTSGALIDFGQATTEISASSGRWRLEGYLQTDKTKRAFRARNAKLFDPSGKLVAQAAEILVPVNAPEKYKIVKK